MDSKGPVISITNNISGCVLFAREMKQISSMSSDGTGATCVAEDFQNEGWAFKCRTIRPCIYGIWGLAELIFCLF